MRILLGLYLLLSSLTAHAVTIEFPEEELARESVLPVFDNAVAVKSRLVPTEKRFEIGLNTGYILNEPFFETSRFGGHLAYHFTETHGVIFQGQMYTEGLGSNGQRLATTDLADSTRVRLDLAPQPKYHFIANYQITPYYGKMSLFKNFVMNLSLYGMLGAGVVDIGGETVPAINIGVGQKFYFNKRWGIRADLGMLAYQGVNFFQGTGGTRTPLDNSTTGFTETVKTPSEFDKQMNYDLHLSLGLIVLL